MPPADEGLHYVNVPLDDALYNALEKRRKANERSRAGEAKLILRSVLLPTPEVVTA